MRRLRWTKGTLAFAAVVLAVGCGDQYEPVPASECAQVTRHARKLLGSHADSRRETMAQYEAATDQERGCAAVADSAADLMRCSRCSEGIRPAVITAYPRGLQAPTKGGSKRDRKKPQTDSLYERIQRRDPLP